MTVPMYRVKITEDVDFDPCKPPMEGDLIAEFEDGKYFAYEVTVQVPPDCGDLDHDWDDVDSLCGVLLDGGFWVGLYTPETIEAAWRPGPDVDHLIEIIDDMLICHGVGIIPQPVRKWD